jgi:hypothetical protein
MCNSWDVSTKYWTEMQPQPAPNVIIMQVDNAVCSYVHFLAHERHSSRIVLQNSAKYFRSVFRGPVHALLNAQARQLSLTCVHNKFPHA